MTPQISHLKAREIIHLHDRAIQNYGGLAGIASPGKIEAIIARVINHSLYEGVDDLHSLAAMYCIAIARGHAFVDGNKRTALNASVLFFLRNGIRLHSVRGLDDIIVKVATGELGWTELTEVFRTMPQDSISMCGNA